MDNQFLQKLSDAELVAHYKISDDKRAVGELYKRYTHLVLGMCIHYFKDKEHAKDAVLQIFEKLFTELKKREIENFRIWLSFVTRNYCISELRKQQTQLSRETLYKYEFQSQPVEPLDEKAVQQEQQLEKLEKGLSALNPFQKKCIELFYFKNMSYNEIVELTGLSVNEVKSHIQNGKRNLKLFISNSR
ncbi:MAG: sigma-70 family RNA polymerase sigma factor [Bacteroidia bacterium]